MDQRSTFITPNIPTGARQVCYRGQEVSVLPNVYVPSDDTFLLVDAVLNEVRPTDTVLEIGTGCGLIAKLVAEVAHSVIATDINPEAVANANLNGVNAIQGDLFAKRDRRFDLVIFNPPYLPAQGNIPNDWLTRAWDGGPSGREVVLRFLSQVEKHLTKKGRVVVLISSITGYRQFREKMKAKFTIVRTITKRKFFFETLYVLLGADARALAERE